MSASGKLKSFNTCPRCKFPNAAAASSCLSCGTPLPLMDATPRSGVVTQRLSKSDLEKVVGAAEARIPGAPPAPAPVPASSPPTAPSPAPALLPPPAQPQATASWQAAPAPPRPASSRPRLDASRAVAWLVCEPLPPVPVVSPVVTIGRGEDQHMVLAHTSVSRGHAIIRVLNDTMLFEDRSTYGSYVNGERQVSVAIRPGDILTIGPYEVRVVSKHDVQPEPGPGETRPLGTSLRDLPSADAMTGRLEKQPLSEVLQTIEFNRKTGTLDLVCGARSGILVVYEGAPIHASFGDIQGEEAVHEMVAQASGYYAFRTKIEAGEQTISKTMTGLLLEASRRLDERPS